MTDIDVTELKARADILEVLTYVGAHIKTSGSWGDDEVEVWCPFCEDLQSSKPAGRANTLKGLYFCFSCGFGGDVISIVREAEGLDFDHAIAWLEEKFPATEENPWRT